MSFSGTNRGANDPSQLGRQRQLIASITAMEQELANIHEQNGEQMDEFEDSRDITDQDDDEEPLPVEDIAEEIKQSLINALGKFSRSTAAKRPANDPESHQTVKRRRGQQLTSTPLAPPTDLQGHLLN